MAQDKHVSEEPARHGATRRPYPTQPEHWNSTMLFEAEERLLASRRRFLKAMIGAGVGAFALAFGLPALAIRTLTQQRETPESGDLLVFASSAGGATAGQPVIARNLAVGTGVHVYPQGKADAQSNLIQLVRIGADEGPESVVAFSAICTHLGCSVYSNLDQNGNIVCPCHNSVFDPREESRVLAGPAARALPTLPVTINDAGEVVVDGEFTDEIGPS